MFVTFPENIDTLTAEQSEALEALISGHDVYCNFADRFWKKPDFSLFCEKKLATNPNA